MKIEFVNKIHVNAKEMNNVDQRQHVVASSFKNAASVFDNDEIACNGKRYCAISKIPPCSLILKQELCHI